MERFELPTERPADQHLSAANSWSPHAGMRATTRPVRSRRAGDAIPAADEPAAPWDPDATVPAPPSYGSLVGMGAAAGCAAAAGIGTLVGWSGASLTFAALVGLDVGVLAGAGVGSLLTRRRQRSSGEAATNDPSRTSG